MQTLYTILIVLAFLTLPAGVLYLCRKNKLLGKIGPVMILYVIGLVIGNVFHPAGMAQVQDILSSAMVPIAIPLLLFGCTFQKSETRSQLLALVTAVISVAVVVVAGYLLFGKNVEDGRQIGAMLTGVYSGGTMNLAALKTMLGVDEATFILLNSYDMVISFIYLCILMSFGIRLVRKWLPNETLPQSDFKAEESVDENPYKGLFTRAGMKDAGILMGFTVCIVAVAALLGLICPDGWFMTIFILALTTLGIAASFVPSVKQRHFAEPIGMYAIYVFSIVVASMADLSKFDIMGSLNTIAYLAFVVFGSFILNILLAKLLKIDADTMTVASVSFICSPPFVPMISTVMKNRRVLVAGLGIGIIGYAIGNYLGFVVFQLLKLL